MTSNFTIKINPTQRQINGLLANVWGKISPLSKIPKYGSDKGECTAIGVFDNEKIVACGILKFLDEKTVELGGIAVLDTYRNKGISKLIYKKRPEILKSKNFKIISYATVGSTVLYRIIENINKLSEYPAFCANITPFVVPVSALKCEKNVSNSIFYKNIGKTAYISTIEFIGMNSKTVIHSISGVEKLMIDFNMSCEQITRKNTGKSFNITIPKTKLRIISGITPEQLNNMSFSSDEIVQMRVSNTEYSNKMISNYRQKGFLFSGVTVDSDNILNLCFIKGLDLAGFSRILVNIMDSDYPENIKSFANHLLKINN